MKFVVFNDLMTVVWTTNNSKHPPGNKNTALLAPIFNSAFVIHRNKYIDFLMKNVKSVHL